MSRVESLPKRRKLEAIGDCGLCLVPCEDRHVEVTHDRPAQPVRGQPMRTSDRLATEDAHQALVFIDCAARLLGDDVPAGGMGRFFMDIELLAPTGFLVGHAVEISLGAYLRISGSRGGLSNHNLESRLKSAIKSGLIVTEKFSKYVTAISPSHLSHQFRYAHDKPEAFISPRHSIPVIRPELERIRDHVSSIAKSRN